MSVLTPVRAFVSVAALAGLGALVSGSLLHPSVAAAAAVLGGVGLWASSRLGLGEHGRLAAGAAVAAGLLGASAALPGFGVPVLGATFLAVVLVAGTLERPVWRSLVSLTWVVALVQLVGAVVATGVLGGALVALGCVSTLCAVVAAHRMRTTTAVLAQSWREADRRGPLPAGRAGSVRARRTGVLRWYVAPVAASVALVALVAGAGLAGDGLGDARSPSAEGPTGPQEGAPAGRTLAAYTGGTLDLRTRGDLPTDPQLEVPAGAPHLWRAAVLQAYDGTAWRLPAEYAAPRVTRPGRSGTVRVTDDGGADGDVAVPPRGAGVRYPVTVLADQTGRPLPVAAPGRLRGVGGARVLQRFPGQWLPVALDRDVSAPTYEVVASGRPSSAGSGSGVPAAGVPAAGVPGAEVARAERVDPGWTALPQTVTPRTRDLAARLVGGATDRLAAVRAVEAYLEETATYSLDSDVPPAGQDAVDHFLFEARSGFCEQFASAAVVLLRAAGVPARLVTGWASDAPGVAPSGPAPGAPAGRVTLRADQAHAWVEVWFPGAGWVTSDPTDGVRLADGAAVPDASPSPSAAQDARPVWRSPALWLAVVLLVAAVVAVLVVRRRRRRPAPAGWPVPLIGVGAAPDPATLVAHRRLAASFARLEAELARCGCPRVPAESLANLAARLPAGAADALAVVERALYGPVLPPAEVLDDAAAGLDAVVAVLRADEAGRSPAQASLMG